MEEKDRIINEIKVVAAKAPRKPELYPDPLWPVDALPTHLSKDQQREAALLGSFASLKALDWKCSSCGNENNASPDMPHLCVKCAREEKNKYCIEKKINKDWMEEAKENGIELFERQPDETVNEWRIWEKYRSYYPLKLPTWAELSDKLGMAPGTVVKAAQKWNYKARILDWARYCDAGSQEERVVAVRILNTQQLNTSNRMMELVNDALDLMSPGSMRPAEVVSMAKLAGEMQLRATQHIEEKVAQPGMIDRVAASQQTTKVEDVNEILEILGKAGALGGKTLGIEHTTRVIVKGGDDE